MEKNFGITLPEPDEDVALQACKTLLYVSAFNSSQATLILSIAFIIAHLETRSMQGQRIRVQELLDERNKCYRTCLELQPKITSLATKIETRYAAPVRRQEVCVTASTRQVTKASKTVQRVNSERASHQQGQVLSHQGNKWARDTLIANRILQQSGLGLNNAQKELKGSLQTMTEGCGTLLSEKETIELLTCAKAAVDQLISVDQECVRMGQRSLFLNNPKLKEAIDDLKKSATELQKMLS